MSNSDQIQRILFSDLNVRGLVVGLEDSYQQALAGHQYPPLIHNLLAEMLAAASLLAANLKFSGRLLIQAQSEQGPVNLMMAEANHKQELRAIARFQEDLPETASFLELLKQGQMAIIIEPEEGQRYQGVVSLEADSLSGCLQSYFAQSEQLPTYIQLQAGAKKAAGLLLQVLPGDEAEGEDWLRVRHLADTLSADELLDLDNKTLLTRLFHEENCRLFEAEEVRFSCDCSYERSRKSLGFMSQDELQYILNEQGKIVINCQFCSHYYEFSQQDIDLLFSGVNVSPASDSVH